MSFLTKKTVLSVDLRCIKCRKEVMMKISLVEGIDSIVLDPPKSTVTVIGKADPIKIVRKVRKFRSSAHMVSVGPAKEEKKDEKKDDEKVEKKDDKEDTSAANPVVLCSTPRTCHRCDLWYVVSQDYVSPCHIL